MMLARVGTRNDVERCRAELARRMAGPQRHRLLQGYPMLPLMMTAEGQDLADVPIDRSRGLIVGVLPHPFCNPAVTGCGFCTFPHESYHAGRAREMVRQVIREIEARTARPELDGRAPGAVYVGGGTANLTPPDAIAGLYEALGRRFDLSGAEITLEGVPAYFLSREARHLDLLAAVPARTARISMGVQTFDPAWLARMGRTAFGDRALIGRALDQARERGLATSVDLLANLPGQPLAAMLEDVRTAAELGADQICAYHLVLHEGMGSAWSRDPALLAARPTTTAALEHWLAVQEELLALGYVQATLTNFERQDVHEGPRRFVYEEKSYTPDRYDGIGFGPGGISCFSDPARGQGVKHVNPQASSAYLARRPGLVFDYGQDPRDLRLLHLTRALARLAADRAAYRAAHGTDPTDDFGPALEAIRDEGLAEITPSELVLTPRGMFYADSVAGLLAWPRAARLRQRLAEERGIEAPLGLGESAGEFMG